MPDLEVEIESLPREMSTSIQQYQMVKLGSPQRSRRLEVVGSMDLDATTSQDASSHVAGRLVTVNEENFLASKTRTGRAAMD